MKIQVFKSTKNGQWYFRFKAYNGRIIAQSEGYKKKAGARKGIDGIRSAFLRYDFYVEEETK